jgi:hypothetical protein
MTSTLRTRKRVDYASILSKYDKMSFENTTSFKPKRRAHPTAAGRANAAPPITKWPVQGLHDDVEYIKDIKSDSAWAFQMTDDVRLPFAHLDIHRSVKWQGLIQQVSMNGSAAARAHFDAITAAMLTATSNPAITECVGEAAAAMAMLERTGWEMIWGFHLHAGTGIDQIWRKPIGNGLYKYRIVEAKGPGAYLNSGNWVPPNYGQMQLGWVVNHLYSMRQNNHAAGVEVCNALNLVFQVAHANYNGATKSYYGLAPTSGHAAAISSLSGVVITARWRSSGRLRFHSSPVIDYL